MSYEKILPVLLIVIDAASAIPYTINGDVGHVVYWIAAAVLNVAVTFMF